MALQVGGFGAPLPCNGEEETPVAFRIGEAFRSSCIPTHPRMEWSEDPACPLHHAMQSGELILRFRDVARGAGPPYFKVAMRAHAKILVQFLHLHDTLCFPVCRGTGERCGFRREKQEKEQAYTHEHDPKRRPKDQCSSPIPFHCILQHARSTRLTDSSCGHQRRQCAVSVRLAMEIFFSTISITRWSCFD